MEILASIFVFTVLIIDGLLPKADLAKNLGILPEEKQGVLSATITTTVNNGQNKPTPATTTVSNREEAGELNGETAQERLEFRQRLEGIKDERKRKAVEAIDENITKNNEKWMNNLTDTLNRLSAILEKIKIKTNELKTNGKDVTKVEGLIAEAEAAISNAQEAVSTQREKTYTISINEESNLGQSVSTTLKEFRSDVKAVFEKIKDARLKVRNSLVALKEIIEEDQE